LAGESDIRVKHGMSICRFGPAWGKQMDAGDGMEPAPPNPCS
jgi:hypothetical protein